MPIKKTKNIRNAEDELRDFFRKIPRMVAVTALEFFRMSFTNQGWKDVSLRKWRPRREGAVRNDKRNLLIDKGRLKRGLRILTVAPGLVVLVDDVPYAGIHNEGGIIKKQVTVRTHERRKHKRTIQSKAHDVKQAIVFRHQRNMNVFITQRKFMGNSQSLNNLL